MLNKAWSGTFGAIVCGTVILVGCGGSTTPAVAPHPTAVVAIRPAATPVLPPDPVTQRGMGQVLAVQSLAHTALGLLNDAATSESEQLPVSALADFTDAARRLAGADTLLARVTAPYQLNDAVLNLRTAVNSLAIAAANRSAHGSEMTAGQHSLAQADADIRHVVNASLPGVVHARDLALLVVSRIPRVRHAARHVVHHVTPRVAPTATATPTVIPAATVSPTAHVAVVVHVLHRRPVRHHHRRTHRAVRRVHVRPSRHHTSPVVVRATAVPTHTPAPAPTATAKPLPTAAPASVLALAPFLSQVREANAQVDVALSEVTRCSNYIQGIRTGTDVGGSARIHACLQAASTALDGVTHALGPVVRHVSNLTAGHALGNGLQSTAQIQAELQSAGHSVDGVSLDDAYVHIQSARSQTETLRHMLATAASKRPL